MTTRTILPEPDVGVDRHIFEISCSQCNKQVNMAVRGDDFRRWKKGMNVQVAFPYLGPKYQELLVNGICSECIDVKIASEEETEEEPDW